MSSQSLASLAARSATLPRLQSAAPEPPRQAKALHAKALWLCAFFPKLPLEAVVRGASETTPLAIFEENSGRRFVYMASMAASTMGVRRGMPLAQAHVLCSALQTQTRDPIAELEKLRQLAAWAQQFTPTVSLQPPRALLLEISGSLRLFGGLGELKKRVDDGLSALTVRAHTAITPTPLASLLLACQERASVTTSREDLRSALSGLPVSMLPIDADAIRRLRNTGVRDLHDLWRLPREGLARRFGPALLNFLDRALGLEPDPRETFHASPRFAAELELFWETDNTAALLEAARSLLARLGRFLRARDAGIACLWLDLHHAKSPPSRLRIGTRHVTRDEGHLLKLLEEHLHRFELPAPALKLRLTTVSLQPFTASNELLFAKHRSFYKRNDELDLDWRQLLEQLQARLGREAVRGLSVLLDYRPEQAWKSTEPGHRSDGTASRRQRPLWLLPNPRPLVSRQSRPWRRGPLSITTSRERIESGWWDDQDIRRDYFVAKDIDGSRLWIFRDLRSHTWFLHGFFG